jgi:hypothetical protein
MYDASFRTVRVIDSAANCPELPIVVGAGHAKTAVRLGSGALPLDTKIPVL